MNAVFNSLLPEERLLRLEIWRQMSQFQAPKETRVLVPPSHLPGMVLGKFPMSRVLVYVDTAEEGMELLEEFPDVVPLIGKPAEIAKSYQRRLCFVVLEFNSALDMLHAHEILNVAAVGMGDGAVIACHWLGGDADDETKNFVDRHLDWLVHGHHLFMYPEGEHERIYRETILRSIEQVSPSMQQQVKNALHEMMKIPELKKKELKEFVERDLKRIKTFEKERPDPVLLRVNFIAHLIKGLAKHRNLGVCAVGHIYMMGDTWKDPYQYVSLLSIKRPFPGTKPKKFHEQMEREYMDEDPFAAEARFNKEDMEDMAAKLRAGELRGSRLKLAEYLGLEGSST